MTAVGACAAVGVLAALFAGPVYRYFVYPSLNQAQAKMMVPVIDSYVDGHAATLLSGYGVLSPDLHPRIFCDSAILEIRPAGPMQQVGLMLNCGEFARQGRTLIEGASGYPGIADTAVLSGTSGHYQVQSVTIGPPYYDPQWVHRYFSHPVAKRVLGTDPPNAPDPTILARKALGFPPGTKAVQAAQKN